MATTVFDSALFRDMFGTPEMRDVFSDEAYLKRCIDAETALARAQAKTGLIPEAAAGGITAKADFGKLDLEQLRHETEIVGYPILPLVRQVSEMCGDAGRYLHWGATTQDIMDTATMLQCARVAIIEEQLYEVREALRDLALKHADTVTAGRTHLQHVLPVTFGFRAAVWLSRHSTVMRNVWSRQKHER